MILEEPEFESLLGLVVCTIYVQTRLSTWLNAEKCNFIRLEQAEHLGWTNCCVCGDVGRVDTLHTS